MHSWRCLMPSIIIILSARSICRTLALSALQRYVVAEFLLLLPESAISQLHTSCYPYLLSCIQQFLLLQDKSNPANKGRTPTSAFSTIPRAVLALHLLLLGLFFSLLPLYITICFTNLLSHLYIIKAPMYVKITVKKNIHVSETSILK